MGFSFTFSKMHTSVVVLLISFGFALGYPTCDECQDAFGKLTTRLLSEESLAEQIELLKSMSCATLPEPEPCNDLVDSWWAVMASILYPSLLDPLDLCTMMMACSASTVRDWTCKIVQMVLPWLQIGLKVKKLLRRALSFWQEMTFVDNQGLQKTAPNKWKFGYQSPCQFLLDLFETKKWSYVRKKLEFVRFK